jgi:hypothetical protein
MPIGINFFIYYKRPMSTLTVNPLVDIKDLTEEIMLKVDIRDYEYYLPWIVAVIFAIIVIIMLAVLIARSNKVLHKVEDNERLLKELLPADKYNLTETSSAYSHHDHHDRHDGHDGHRHKHKHHKKNSSHGPHSDYYTINTLKSSAVTPYLTVSTLTCKSCGSCDTDCTCSFATSD